MFIFDVEFKIENIDITFVCRELRGTAENRLISIFRHFPRSEPLNARSYLNHSGPIYTNRLYYNYESKKHVTSNRMSMHLCHGVTATGISPPCVNAILSLPRDLSLGEYELLRLLYVFPEPEDKAGVPIAPPATLLLQHAKFSPTPVPSLPVTGSLLYTDVAWFDITIGPHGPWYSVYTEKNVQIKVPVLGGRFARCTTIFSVHLYNKVFGQSRARKFSRTHRVKNFETFFF